MSTIFLSRPTLLIKLIRVRTAPQVNIFPLEIWLLADWRPPSGKVRPEAQRAPTNLDDMFDKTLVKAWIWDQYL